MNTEGKLFLKICGSKCCNTGKLNSPRDDFKKNLVDTFDGGNIGRCNGFDIGDKRATLTVPHSGLDGWRGNWIR